MSDTTETTETPPDMIHPDAQAEGKSLHSAPGWLTNRQSRRWWALLLVGVIVAVLALGWFADALAQIPPQATATTGAQTQQAGLYRISLTLTPAPARAGANETIRLQVSDVSGVPVTGAQVSYALTMPAMDMPGGAGLAHATGNGVYQLSGGFSMSGAWSLRVGVTPPLQQGAAQATDYTTFTIAVQ